MDPRVKPEDDDERERMNAAKGQLALGVGGSFFQGAALIDRQLHAG